MKKRKFDVKKIPEKLSVWRKLIKHLPNHCKYCGKKYTNFQYKSIDGKCCPNGHMGYIKWEITYSTVFEYFDNTKNPIDLSDYD